MRKKAQNVGQVMVYLLTVVIMGAILLFGYRSIMDFKGRTDKISMVDFQKKLESSVMTITPEYGTLKRKTFILSTDFKEACIATNYGNPSFNPELFEDYPVIEDAVIDSETGKNIFLVTNDNQVSESFSIGNTMVNGNFRCFQVIEGKLSISIEGKGDHVVIS